ncbi:helix-turn-helix domain-containing protein [Brevibacterium litoralis]|uniref:helix-turn-helix domain-containing protein n=1 Tax=Brevibacterium litoralis TaxID=3138935 RepID=UPI0032ECDA13
MENDTTRSDTTTLTALIGSRVRTARTEQGWTLDRLAEATGVSRRMLVNVEKGATNPSLETLLRLSSALGIGLPDMVRPPDPLPVDVVRAGDGAELWSGPSGGRGLLMAGTRPPDVLELWDWTLAPDEDHASEAHSPGTQEALRVHSGSLVFRAGDQEVTLGPGDALSTPGDVPHTYANPTDTPTHFTLAVFEPGIGATPPDPS